MLAACVAYGACCCLSIWSLRLEADASLVGDACCFYAALVLGGPAGSRWPWPAALLGGALAGRGWPAWAGGACLVLNVEIPWRKLMPEPMPRQTLRVLSCNCDVGRLQIERLAAFDRRVRSRHRGAAVDRAARLCPAVFARRVVREK